MRRTARTPRPAAAVALLAQSGPMPAQATVRAPDGVVPCPNARRCGYTRSFSDYLGVDKEMDKRTEISLKNSSCAHDGPENWYKQGIWVARLS